MVTSSTDKLSFLSGVSTNSIDQDLFRPISKKTGLVFVFFVSFFEIKEFFGVPWGASFQSFDSRENKNRERQGSFDTTLKFLHISFKLLRERYFRLLPCLESDENKWSIGNRSCAIKGNSLRYNFYFCF